MKSSGRRLLFLTIIALVIVALIAATVVANHAGSSPAPRGPAGASPQASSSLALNGSTGPSPAGPSARPAAQSGFDQVSPTLLTQARTDLAALKVAPAGPQTGYSRAQFGPAWDDHCTTTGCGNKCDTRNDILARDLLNAVIAAGGCEVLSGTLDDPYTGKVIAFVRGAKTSAAVQIDHLVPLGDAWRTGAPALSAAQRLNLANDPRNLVAVDGPTNGAKSDYDASAWLPPAPAAHCAYVVHQVEVKFIYHLWVTPAELKAIEAVLAGC